MPARRMTPEEKAAWLGGGQLLFGLKKPDFFPKGPAEKQSDPGAGTQPAPSEAQAQPNMIDSGPAQQRNLDQEAHDRRMAAMSPEERRAMLKRLADLARSKLGAPAFEAEKFHGGQDSHSSD